MQVLFKILPGKEISTDTTNIEETVGFAEKYLSNFDNKNIKVKTFRYFSTVFL